MRNFFKKIAIGINIFLVVFTLIIYSSKFISPNFFWQISITGIFFPWAILANFIFLLFWLLKKNKYFFLSFLTLFMGLDSILTFINFNRSETISKDAFNFVSYNLAGLRLYKKIKKKEDQKKWLLNFKSFVNQKGNVKIMSLQEIQYDQIEILKSTFGLKYAFKHPKLGTAIISKFPIIDKGTVNIGKTSNSVTWADIQLPVGHIIRVYSVHLQSNKISGTADYLAKKSDLENIETYLKVKKIFRRYKESAQTRESQTIKLIDHIKKSQRPTIVSGDFNDTPQSIIYSYISDIMQDGFVEQGFGIGTTFGGTIPLLRIDYIFAQKEFQFLDYQVFYGDYSDHYPVISHIKYK